MNPFIEKYSDKMKRESRVPTVRDRFTCDLTDTRTSETKDIVKKMLPFLFEKKETKNQSNNNNNNDNNNDNNNNNNNNSY